MSAVQVAATPGTGWALAGVVAWPLGVALLGGVVSGWLARLWIRKGGLAWVAVPNHRSSHEVPTPTGGGVAFATAATLAAVVASLDGDEAFWMMAAPALAVLALVGLVDDRRGLAWPLRLAVQVGVVAVLVAWVGARVGPGEWPSGAAGWGLAAVLLLAGLWWVNLFNFMDGTDGLAASQGLFMLLAGAALALPAMAAPAREPLWICALGAAAAVAAFLPLNWAPARVFMGDAGSTWLGGLILAWALATVAAGWLPAAAWLILGAVFASDATVTLGRRVAAGRRWHEAHRSHAYQRLSRRWAGAGRKGHARVAWLALALNLGWTGPLALAATVWPAYAPGWVALAYAPLVVAVLAVGAGRDDDGH